MKPGNTFLILPIKIILALSASVFPVCQLMAEYCFLVLPIEGTLLVENRPAY